MPLSHRLHDRCGCLAAASEEASGAARPFAFATSPRNFERDRPFLIDHLALDLALDVPQKSVSGTASIDIHRVDPSAETVAFDAVGFEIHQVTIGGSKARYAYDGRSLTVMVPKSLQVARIAVAYKATPRRGLYFLEPDEHYPNRPRQVWSQCQEEDARHFIPCHDKPHVKMTTELTVRVPNGWTVLSNGALVSKSTPKDGDWKFHWKMEEPHPSYLLTLVAGEFSELPDKAGDVPLTYLVPKGREEDGRRTFSRTPDMIGHFGEITGVPYPWNKYAQVVVSDFIFGGMENTTATTMYEHILLDERAEIDITSDDLIAHELAHQWFGDFVTCRDWSEAWLNEGFATFMEHVWKAKRLGADEYDYGVKGDLSLYLSEANGRYRRPIVCQDYDAPLDLFDRHLYEKGGLVLHILKAELGAQLFWRGVNLYLTRNARSLVETRDLQRALEEVSGRSMGKIFEQWVHKPGHPELEVVLSWESQVLKVAVKQTHSSTDGVPSVFEMPLVLEVVDSSPAPSTGANALRTRRERVHLAHRSETFAIPCEERPKFVVVDPELVILGEVHVKAPNDMLRAQLELAATGRGRWLAAEALASSDDPPTIAALTARLEDHDEFWGVRVEAAEALGKIRARECFDALSKNAGTKHPKVRRSVMSALGRFKTSAAVEALRPRALGDASYLVEAEAARSLGKTRQNAAFDVLLDVLDRPSWGDVIRVGAIEGLAALRDDRAAPHVLARTRYGQPNRARRAAILAVPKLVEGRRGREALEDLLDDTDPHLRIDVVRAVADVGDPKSRPALRARLDTDLDARVRRRLREALRDLGGETKRATEQLKDDVEKLQNETNELKARLAMLEAKGGKKAGSGTATATKKKGRASRSPKGGRASRSPKGGKKRG
jgi:aminopeptidase N